jgi:hypothetical protein
LTLLFGCHIGSTIHRKVLRTNVLNRWSSSYGPHERWMVI